MKYLVLMLTFLILSCSSETHNYTEDAAKCVGSPNQTVGLFKNEPETFPGYTLFATGTADKVHLINNEGLSIHEWAVSRGTAAVYLLQNGNLIHNSVARPFKSRYGKSATTRIQEFTWEGKRIWYYNVGDLPNERLQFHHDIARLPNGNILALAWEKFSQEEAILEGRNPALLEPKENNDLWSEAIVEIQPDYVTGKGGKIVWEWHLIDHVVQESYPQHKNYYGPNGIYEHPELVDLNFVSTGSWANLSTTDWIHMNSIDYNPKTDQIILSARGFSELWIIDHSTTEKEASGHTGGKGNKGGDLVYRFGNPQTYHRGKPENQELFYQHDVQWIARDLPGEGNILIFNNRATLSEDDKYSAVVELKPDMSEYGKGTIVWSYSDPVHKSFFAPIISGAERLPNGNTLIDEGTKGRLFEVTPAGDVTWIYVSPETPHGIMKQGERVLPISSDYLEVPEILRVTENVTFRARKYATTYPGVQSRNLEHHGPIEKYPALTECQPKVD